MFKFIIWWYHTCIQCILVIFIQSQLFLELPSTCSLHTFSTSEYPLHSPSNFIYSLIKKLYHTVIQWCNLCCLCACGCRATHWSTANLQCAALWKKIDSLFINSHRLCKEFTRNGALRASLQSMLGYWLDYRLDCQSWAGNHYFCEFMVAIPCHVKKTLFCWSSAWPLALRILLPLLSCSSLRRGSVIKIFHINFKCSFYFLIVCV